MPTLLARALQLAGGKHITLAAPVLEEDSRVRV